MNIFKIAAQLAFDGTRFKAGLSEAKSLASNFGKDLTSGLKGEIAGIFGAGALIAFTKSSLEAIGAMKDGAEQLSITTDEFQRLEIAADNSGLKMENLTGSFRSFVNNRKAAVESNEELRKAFGRLGFSLDDLQNPQKNFVDFLMSANVALQNMSPEQKTRALNDMSDTLGKIGPRLQGFVDELEKAKNASIVPESAINDVDELEKKIKSLGRTIRNTVAEIAVDVADRPFALEGAGNPVLAPILRLMRRRAQNQARQANAGRQTGEQFGPNQPEAKALFEDKILTGSLNDALSTQLDLEKAIFGFKLKQLDAEGQRQAQLEKLNQDAQQLADREAEVAQFGGLDPLFAAREMGDINKRKADLLNQLAGLQENKTGRPLEVDALTKVGQLGGGRNIVADSQGPVPMKLDKQIALQQMIKEAMVSLNTKIKGSTTLRGSE